MKIIRTFFKSIEAKYLKILNLVQSKYNKKLDGRLVVKDVKYGPQYYHRIFDRESKSYKMKYLKKSNTSLIYALAQNAYLQSVRLLVNRRLKQIKRILRFMDEFDPFEVDNLYKNLKVSRRAIFKPVVPTREQIIARWMAEEHVTKPFDDGDLVLYTKKGERVRSKSEKILADMLFDFGLNYKYEKPFRLANGRIVFPDFTILHPVTLEEVYWEHFGMMDKPVYANAAIRKIDDLIASGLDASRNLIYTFESSEKILNLHTAKILIKKYLLVF